MDSGNEIPEYAALSLSLFRPLAPSPTLLFALSLFLSLEVNENYRRNIQPERLIQVR